MAGSAVGKTAMDSYQSIVPLSDLPTPLTFPATGKLLSVPRGVICIIWDYVNSIVRPVLIIQGLADHQQGFIDTITILSFHWILKPGACQAWHLLSLGILASPGITGVVVAASLQRFGTAIAPSGSLGQTSTLPSKIEESGTVKKIGLGELAGAVGNCCCIFCKTWALPGDLQSTLGRWEISFSATQEHFLAEKADVRNSLWVVQINGLILNVPGNGFQDELLHHFPTNTGLIFLEKIE